MSCARVVVLCAAALPISPYLLVAYRHYCVRWGDRVCHVARRDTVFRFPESIPLRCQSSISIFGPEGDERLCDNANDLCVYRLATGELLYRSPKENCRWLEYPTVGAFLCAPNFDQECDSLSLYALCVCIYSRSLRAQLTHDPCTCEWRPVGVVSHD